MLHQSRQICSNNQLLHDVTFSRQNLRVLERERFLLHLKEGSFVVTAVKQSLQLWEACCGFSPIRLPGLFVNSRSGPMEDSWLALSSALGYFTYPQVVLTRLVNPLLVVFTVFLRRIYGYFFGGGGTTFLAYYCRYMCFGRKWWLLGIVWKYFIYGNIDGWQ